ncbi:hypothetical protein OG906_43165 (plasmid) [Streptomyces sp. NBC_01426]|uniref:hypothetical protein n=1 Tax=Streptomyces sp. NBC_01426 TaxID=2975866 RepID=UPI002E365289|nr:hypothetical protein [Streptomyces sp. NBC_01426]
MTSSEADPAAVPADQEAQQIPVVISMSEVDAATDARDALLRAIGAEAQIVADKFPGQAAKALVDLANAYALVTAGTTAVATVSAPTRSFASTISNLQNANENASAALG